MEVRLKKQPQKYLEAVDETIRKKLYRALRDISVLKGNIVPLKGKANLYRYKMEHYRIIFEWRKEELIIIVIEINTRTNIKY